MVNLRWGSDCIRPAALQLLDKAHLRTFILIFICGWFTTCLIKMRGKKLSCSAQWAQIVQVSDQTLPGSKQDTGGGGVGRFWEAWEQNSNLGRSERVISRSSRTVYPEDRAFSLNMDLKCVWFRTKTELFLFMGKKLRAKQGNKSCGSLPCCPQKPAAPSHCVGSLSPSLLSSHCLRPPGSACEQRSRAIFFQGRLSGAGRPACTPTLCGICMFLL